MFERDFYINDEVYQEYLEGKREGVHFNSAAIAAPFAEAREAAKKFLKEKVNLPKKKNQRY